MNNVVCEHCQQPLQYPRFNFCSYCGKRIIDTRNTHNVEELIQMKVDENKEFSSYIKLFECKKCRFKATYKTGDNFCCMCSYPIENPKYNYLKKEVGIQNLDINLGRFNYELDSDEVCLFHQDDVAWYEIQPDNLWQVIAAGTLYLTDKKVILYDKGFSNIWTKLSVSGDFPEQTMSFKLENLFNIVGPINVGPNLTGCRLETSFGNIILAPSERKYRGRQTPMMDNYKSFETFHVKLLHLMALIN